MYHQGQKPRRAGTGIAVLIPALIATLVEKGYDYGS